MITKKEFLFLYEKNLSGECTPEEKQLLESYQDNIVMPDDQWDAHLGDKKRLHHLLKTRLKNSIPDKSFSGSRKYRWLKIAASIFAVSAAGILLWRSQHPLIQKQNYTVA